MTRRSMLSLLVTLAGFALMYFGHAEGALLAGGGPCLIIINEGGRAYGAIEKFKFDGGVDDVSKLEAAVLTSCSLIQYGAVEKRFEGEYLEGPVLKKIGDFHAKLIMDIGGADYNIHQETVRLEKYNRRLCNLIEPGTYPED